MRLLCLAGLLIGSQSIFSQFIVGTIKEAETNSLIPYVNVWYRGTPIGTFSNELGEFQLPVSDRTIISFSSVGYECLEFHWVRHL